MTCFWDALLLGIPKDIRFNNQREFVIYLQSHNIETVSISVNNAILTQKELEENIERVKNYDVNTINDGYLCSAFDPFLILVAELFKINIYHNFNGNMIEFIHNKPIYNLYLNSSSSHCSFNMIKKIINL